jgi:hypothetical protein
MRKTEYRSGERGGQRLRGAKDCSEKLAPKLIRALELVADTRKAEYRSGEVNGLGGLDIAVKGGASYKALIGLFLRGWIGSCMDVSTVLVSLRLDA